MLRIRFTTDLDDPRPINWPLKHPYWITGESGDGRLFYIVSYADDLDYIFANWPEAKTDEIQEVDGYVFSSRFPKPDWFTA